MDYYQGVVLDYLRADKAIFVNPECCIQINDGPSPDHGGTHWYCDAVAVDLRNETVFLCEVTYAVGSAKLVKRLREWGQNWGEVRAALIRDCKVNGDWLVRPWLFVPEKSIAPLVSKLKLIKGIDELPVYQPRITSLESVQPWRYHSWGHQDKNTDRPDSVPAEMRV